MLRQPDFVDRNNFADALNRRGLLGVAVEVGVHRADFASLFLANWRGRLYVGVDPWEPYPEAHLLWDSETRDEDYRFSARRLAPHGGRAELRRCTSAEAAPAFADGSLSFVHVDGDHSYAEARQDLRLWWPKVEPGGWLACHDFLSQGVDGAADGVQPAVLEFAELHGLDVWLVTETRCDAWSCYVEKPRG